MKARRTILILRLAAVLFAAGSIVAASGVSKNAVPDDRAWMAIVKSGVLDVYMAEATSHFGAREVAAETYKDWAVDYWKSQRSFRSSKQRFLTHGIIFCLGHHDDRWTLESILSKEGDSIEITHSTRNGAEDADTKRD